MTKRKKSRKETSGGLSRRTLWQAVKTRNVAADGAFVYAVRSTGVYCRPSCPARRPRPANVRFFRFPEAAERAGFRPCRRCKPSATPPGDPKLEAVEKICRLIDTRVLADSIYGKEDGRLTLTGLGAAAGISAHQLERAFRKVMGITPRQYVDAQRMRRLKLRLKEGSDVTTAIYDAGFGSSSRLYERAASQFGMTPAEYGRGGAGMVIRYTIEHSPLGRLLVGGTERGISSVCLGESDAALRAALREEYPRAELLPENQARNAFPKLGRWVATIVAHLRGREPHLNLPTDVRATAFQRRVWEELRKIPCGATRTYTEVARALGQPSAARAVARACAMNPTAVVVPCHRVVREDGDLAGYRWGISRKRRLLETESQAAGRRK